MHAMGRGPLRLALGCQSLNFELKCGYLLLSIRLPMTLRLPVTGGGSLNFKLKLSKSDYSESPPAGRCQWRRPGGPGHCQCRSGTQAATGSANATHWHW